MCARGYTSGFRVVNFGFDAGVELWIQVQGLILRCEHP